MQQRQECLGVGRSVEQLYLSIYHWSLFSVLDEGEEYECAGVLSNHSQDVKCVRWHPHEEVAAVAIPMFE